MPRPTFFNLPADKRDRIVALAIDEFSERPYGEASLSRIVARAGIAKGSMYQYFEDKLDLYRWLVTEVVAARKRALVDEAALGASDLFARVEAMALAAVRFAVEHPRLVRLAAGASLPAADQELQALHAGLQEAGTRALADMIAAAQTSGQVRKDIDPRLAAVFLGAALRECVMHVLLARLGVGAAEFFRRPELTRGVAADELQRLIAPVVSMVRAGLVAPRAERSS